MHVTVVLGVDGISHPVCYVLKKFYHLQRFTIETIGKEVLALSLAVQHFEVYLGASQHVVVYTDHDPLKFLGPRIWGFQLIENHESGLIQIHQTQSAPDLPPI